MSGKDMGKIDRTRKSTRGAGGSPRRKPKGQGQKQAPKKAPKQKNPYSIKGRMIGLTLAFAVAIGAGVVTSSSTMGKADDLDVRIASAHEAIAEQEARAKRLSEGFDKDAYKKEVEDKIVTGEEVAKKVIEVDNELASFYKVGQPLSGNEEEDKKVLDRVERFKKKDVELRDTKDHTQTWSRNPEWTLKLESVVAYRNPKVVPMLFSLTTKDGHNAGLIEAEYYPEKGQILNAKVHYTKVGMADEASIGGK